MLKIEDGVIYLTRGDSASLTVTVTKSDGTEYTMADGDVMTLTVRDTPSKTGTQIFSVESSSTTIDIAHSDTSEQNVGQYSADIQLTTADGHVYTIWPELDEKQAKSEANFKNFWLTPEVTI